MVGKDKIWLGIDPGMSGGLAVVSKGEVVAGKMPDTDRDILNWLLNARDYDAFACIELVTGYVGTKRRRSGKGGEEVEVPGDPGSSQFKLGTSYGKLLMALCAADIPYEKVPARVWQQSLGLHRNGAGYTEWKRVLKAKAQQLFPKVQVTLHNADALLIAEHCRRSRR